MLPSAPCYCGKSDPYPLLLHEVMDMSNHHHSIVVCCRQLVEPFRREGRSGARHRYRQFVLDGIGKAGLGSNLRQPIYLGDEKFVERMQNKVQARGDKPSISKQQPPCATASPDS